MINYSDILLSHDVIGSHPSCAEINPNCCISSWGTPIREGLPVVWDFLVRDLFRSDLLPRRQ